MAQQTSGLGFTGQRVKRVEDERLLIGEGTFVADIQPEGALHASFVRSPFPHANIRSINVAAARRHPGVAAVLTGAEVNAVTNKFVPFITMDGLYTPLYQAMSDTKVRHIGDPVAIVIAESRYIAEDAAELVEVDYDIVEGIGSIDRALDPSLPQLWEHADGNVLYDGTDTYGEVDTMFTLADRVVTETFTSHRQSNQPMETRGTLVEVDPVTGHLTIHAATQAPHFLKWAVAALTADQSAVSSLRQFIGKKDRRKAFAGAAKDFLKTNGEKMKKADSSGQTYQMKKEKGLLKAMSKMGLGLLAADDYPTVKSIDIGGGFGAKGPVAREDIAVVVAAQKLGKTVQWIEDRVENLADGGHAREEVFTLSLALNNDGTFKALKCDLILDGGAYPSFPISNAATKQLLKVYLPGPYDFKAYQIRGRIVASNKGKVVPYRGPWANECWVRERLIDKAAHELGRDPGDLRLQNMIGEDLPRAAMITGPTLDETNSTKKTLQRAIEMIDYDQLAIDKAEAESRNHRIGLGIASYLEAAPGPPNFGDSVSPGTDMFLFEDGRATVEADGKIVVYTSQSPHGQSHQTTYKQVTADEFGVAMEDVEVVWGNTDRTQFSLLGTGGSRGGPLGAGVLRMTSRQVRQSVVREAANMLEASVGDIVIENGNIHVAGVPSRGITYADVAAKVASTKGVKDGPVFEEELKYEGVGNGGWSVATHVAWVDVDLDTGQVTIPRYLVVEDCGPIINPGIVDGQVRGGVAQGIGAVFYENAYYDEEANLQASTYMDYLVPTAMEIPRIEIEHMETLTDGENDARGTGEGGMIGTPAALTNAVSDALGIEVNEQYLPPARILELAGVIEPD